ncbi:MAG: glycine dehydrogenase [Clostridiales bacterium]|nr:glycine dehydrogenase [Clostridiales bacterium]
MDRYLPDTLSQQREMLACIGVENLDGLFSDVPEGCRLGRGLKLPVALSEMDLQRYMKNMALKNASMEDYVCFLGAGAYEHFIPATVGHVVSRQEFYTAYTPYQPEISQGTLQAIFEYQTMICELTGMEVANASMYDGATAMAEAAAMACRSTRRKRILVAKTVNPEYRSILSTYSRYNGNKVIEIDMSRETGVCDIDKLNEIITSGSVEGSVVGAVFGKAFGTLAKEASEIAAIIIQSPNFFGIIEDIRQAAEIAHKIGALLIACVDPVSLALLKPPGELRADIVIGEGQALGNPLSFGGPYLGFFATKRERMRKMPGRVVGETTDLEGRRGFVLTLQTREQHIRREKATSNICSNQALNALTAAVYMSLLGKEGMKEVAKLCLQKAHYTYEKLLETGKFEPLFNRQMPFFKEFALKSRTCEPKKINQRLLEHKIFGGYCVGRDFPEMADGWLIAVTEKRTRQEIDLMVSIAGEVGETKETVETKEIGEAGVTGDI